MKTTAQCLKNFALVTLTAGFAWIMPPMTARAQSAGSLDSSFNDGTGANESIISVAVQADGKILIGGDPFSAVEGVPRPGLARLNADGSLDTGFVPDTKLFSGPLLITAIAVLGNGQIIVAGSFGIARLNADGSRDTSFTNSGGYLFAALPLPNGQVLDAGEGGVSRLNTDGSVDNAFNAAINSSGTIYTLALQTDGKVIAGGDFIATSANHVARLNTDGSLDSSFNTGTGADSTVQGTAVQADGKVLLVGLFENFNGVAKTGIVRLNSDGSIDTGFNVHLNNNQQEFRDVAVQSDGKIVVGGFFEVGPTGSIVYRLNPDGSNDTSFVPDAGLFADQSDALALQSDGKIVVTSESGQVFRVNGGSGGGSSHPAFFSGEAALGNGVYYLAFSNGSYFGYYSYLNDQNYIYHFDLGYEYLFDANDGKSGVYLYDFASSSFFYTSPTFAFPYLYDFSLNAVLYYYPDTTQAGHYTTNPRYFFNFATGQIITK